MITKIKKIIATLIGIEETYPSATRRIQNFAKEFSKTDFKITEKFDIIIPSKDRPKQLIRTIEYLYQNLKSPFNLIIIDNASESETINVLKSFEKHYSNIKVIYKDKNLGGAESRIVGLENSKSKYVAFLDNDILIMPYYFENLFQTLLSDDKLAAVQSKVIFPNQAIQINSPTFKIEDKWIIYSDSDSNKSFDDPSTSEEKVVPWIPIGATLWERSVLEQFELDKTFNTSYEDNDLTYRISQKGLKFKNCPKALCIHFNSQFTPSSNIYKNYIDGRYNLEVIRNSAKEFYKKHGLVICIGDRQEYIKNYLKFDSEKEYLEFLNA